MHYSAIQIPTTHGPVLIAEASQSLDALASHETLPQNWQGIPVAEASVKKSPLRYSTRRESGFHPLQLFENARYYLRVPDSAELRTSFPNLETIPDAPCAYFFSIDNYLGTAWIKVGEDPPLRFDVVSRKLGYHDEYRAIVEAIASQCNQLLLEWSAPTALRFEPDPKKQKQILLEQFLFLRHVLSSEKLDLYLETIRRNPHNSLEFEDDWKPAGAAIPAPAYFEQPLRFGRNWSYTAGKAAQPAEIITRRKFETLDTPTNRFVKFALERFQDVCERVIRSFARECGTAWMEAHDMRDTLDAFLSAPFFRDVGRLSYMPANNQTLLKREGYREILHAWLMLEASAQLNWPGRGDAYDGTTRDVPTLYEYWLYFVMRQTMLQMENASEIEIHAADAKTTKPFIERSSDGLRLNLKQGQSSLSAFAWHHNLTGRSLRVHFYFNRTFAPHPSTPGHAGEVLRAGSYSRPFRPDFSLVIFPEHYAAGKHSIRSLLQAEHDAEKEGAIALLHFDAKYRVEKLEEVFGKALKQSKSIDGFEEEIDSEVMKELEDEHRESAVRNTYKRGDLLKMHTYNEAIRRTAGSYVLYPGRSEENAEFRRFHEILPGVGAFIARPIPNGDNDKIEMEGDGELRRFIEDVLKIQQNKFSQLYRVNYWTHDTIKEPPRTYSITTPGNTKTPPRDTNVLLVFMRNPKLAVKCRKASCFYYHAVKEDGTTQPVNLMDLKAEYVIPYGVGRMSFDWMARMDSVNLLQRKELAELLDVAPEDFESNCEYYYVVNLDIQEEPPPVKELSHLIPPRKRDPKLVKWSDLWPA